MQNIISFLDFLPGKKTLIGTLATSFVFIYSAFLQKEFPVNPEQIVEFVLVVASTTKGIATLSFTLYGIVLKLLRNFK